MCLLYCFALAKSHKRRHDEYLVDPGNNIALDPAVVVRFVVDIVSHSHAALDLGDHIDIVAAGTLRNPAGFHNLSEP
jgi:hypothetical protein